MYTWTSRFFRNQVFDQVYSSGTIQPDADVRPVSILV